MNYIEDYIAQEKLKLNWFERITKSYSKLTSTKILASPLPKIKSGNEKILRPSWWLSFASIALLFPVTFIAITIALSPFYAPFTPPFLLAPPLAGFVLYLFIKNSAFNRKVFYKMTLNTEGIKAGKKNFLWSEIAETAIRISQGKGTTSYLVIFKKDKTIVQLSLQGYIISDSKMALLVEYYKNNKHQDNNND